MDNTDLVELEQKLMDKIEKLNEKKDQLQNKLSMTFLDYHSVCLKLEADKSHHAKVRMDAEDDFVEFSRIYTGLLSAVTDYKTDIHTNLYGLQVALDLQHRENKKTEETQNYLKAKLSALEKELNYVRERTISQRIWLHNNFANMIMRITSQMKSGCLHDLQNYQLDDVKYLDFFIKEVRKILSKVNL